jgi:DNA segregation ATPase FtsK/SpoIIIE-like protein
MLGFRRTDRVARVRSALIGLLALLWIGTAAAQALPDEAATALRAAQRSAAEALATYERHSPDRPLWSEALRAGTTAARAAPDHPAPQRFLAQAYLQVGWYARSWDAWRGYLANGGTVDSAVERQLVQVAEWMGLNAFAAGRSDDAVPFFETVLRYRPDDLAANDRLARVYLERGDAAAALPYLEALDGRVPELEAARDRLLRVDRFGTAAVDAFDAGVAARAAGASATALARFQEAAARAPSYTAAWRAVADLAEGLGRSGVARDAYLELVDRDDRDAAALAGLGRLALADDDLEAAAGWFERAAAAAPGEAAYAAARAEAERRIEERIEAEEAAAQAAEEAAARAAAEAAAEAERAAAEAEAQAQREAAAQAEREAAARAAEEAEARAAAEAAEQEAARQAAERAAEERAAEERTAAEEEAARLAAEEEAARAAAEEAARREAEEAARLAAEEEAARRAAEERERTEALARAAQQSVLLLDATTRHAGDAATPSPSVLFVSAPWLATDLSARADDTLYLRLQVQDKPSDAPVQYQVCLVPPDVTVRPACTDPGLLAFTAPGAYQGQAPWSDLVGADAIDWREGVDTVMLVLRRGDGRPIDAGGDAGDLARYLPMTGRIQLLAVPSGAPFPGWP